MQESEAGEISHHNGIITAEGIDLIEGRIL
jgi:hypothetical protein